MAMSEHAMITETQLRRIEDVAADLGLGPDDWEPYGRYKAKIGLHVRRLEGTRAGKAHLHDGHHRDAGGRGEDDDRDRAYQSLGLLGRRCASRCGTVA